MTVKKPLHTLVNSPTKNQIVGALLAGERVSDVAKQYGLQWQTCKAILTRYLQRGTTHNAPRSGRPPKLSDRDKRRLLRLMKKHRRATFTELAKIFSPKVSSRTIRRVLHDHGYSRHTAHHVPYIRPETKTKRLWYSRQLAHLKPEEYDFIIFTDETYIFIGESPGKVYITRSPDENDLPETFVHRFKKSSLKIMVWAGIMLGSKGPIVVLDFPGGRGGGMNSKRYCDQVLSGPFLEYYTAMRLERGEVYMMQDNARCHTSKSTLQWFAKHEVILLDHPPTSPDLNPIENVWADIKRAIRSRPRAPTSIEELKTAVFEAWESLRQEDIDRYILSMPKRVQAVLKAKGGNTQY
jgi:transposase